VIKHNFDQTPILLETFDQVIRSSEIRSSDPLSSLKHHLIVVTFLVVFCSNSLNSHAVLLTHINHAWQK
jgi:hypothetical protein